MPLDFVSRVRRRSIRLRFRESVRIVRASFCRGDQQRLWMRLATEVRRVHFRHGRAAPAKILRRLGLRPPDCGLARRSRLRSHKSIVVSARAADLSFEDAPKSRAWRLEIRCQNRHKEQDQRYTRYDSLFGASSRILSRLATPNVIAGSTRPDVSRRFTLSDLSECKRPEWPGLIIGSESQTAAGTKDNNAINKAVCQLDFYSEQ